MEVVPELLLVVLVGALLAELLAVGYGKAESAGFRFDINDEAESLSSARFVRTFGFSKEMKNGVSSPSYGAAVIPSTICPMKR
jgi:hypothetical protein